VFISKKDVEIQNELDDISIFAGRSRMKSRSVILLIILLALTIPIFTQEDIEVEFEDPGLEQAIREAINKPSGDIYADDLKELKKLNAAMSNIESLRGIEYCNSIELLILMHNQISDISALAGLTSLLKLSLNNNRISNISPLSGLVLLEFLDLNNNQISDISPLSGLNSMKWLILKDNPLNEAAKNVIIPNFTKEGVEVYYK
jgi:Leucine-rich repeat (LRR) protein